ncbi:MAG: cytochrome c oxidase subunit 3 family protein [Gammaproteobacteria bacterium]|nr:cytochrome c oxidase subunit 3 family protein [Gammaproteobacteria bacterium]
MDTTTTTEPSVELPRLLPGDFAIWFFIFAELLVFAIAFISYAVVRIQNVEMFNQYQLTLNRELGAANTLLLITASYFVVRAIHAIRLDDVKNCIKWLYASLACGSGFLLLKSLEYYDKFADGINLSTNTFYMFYLSLTMFHFLHVILGMIILFAIAIKAQRGGYSAQDHIGIETGASYWHMVDLVWIILFPLVYIIR